MRTSGAVNEHKGASAKWVDVREMSTFAGGMALAGFVDVRRGDGDIVRGAHQGVRGARGGRAGAAGELWREVQSCSEF